MRPSKLSISILSQQRRNATSVNRKLYFSFHLTIDDQGNRGGSPLFPVFRRLRKCPFYGFYLVAKMNEYDRLLESELRPSSV